MTLQSLLMIEFYTASKSFSLLSPKAEAISYPSEKVNSFFYSIR